MKTAAIWISLAVIGGLQARTSLAIADQVTLRVADGLRSFQLEAAADAVLYPARMVRLAAGEGGRAAPKGAAHILKASARRGYGVAVTVGLKSAGGEGVGPKLAVK